MTTPFRVNSVTFSGGQTIDTSGADVVVLVGPNNTGKSQALTELKGRLIADSPVERPPYKAIALQGAVLERCLNQHELADWFREHRSTKEVEGRTFIESPSQQFDLDGLVASFVHETLRNSANRP